MWICADCNQLVPNPVNRKCPNGHGLFDSRIWGSTKEVTMGASFRNTLLVCLAVVALIVFTRKFWGAEGVAGAIVAALILIMLLGFNGFMRGRKWRRQGGAVLRLVPRANGMALGCITAGLGLMLLALAVDAAR